MKALILVGGFGTRLRPLTFTCPKPLVPFANKPMIMHQIEALEKVGVTEVVLAIGYEPEKMKKDLDVAMRESGLTIKITYSHEKTPMGTAGPLSLARDVLTTDNEDNMFFVLNSDVTCLYPLAELVSFHKNHGKEGTIMVTPVEDPSKYGVVVHNDDGKIEKFIEKPQTFVGRHINAGLYIFNTSILKRIPNKPCSIERVIFPAMAEDKELYAMALEGYWMDVGQPHDFLTGMCLYLGSRKVAEPKSRPGVTFKQPVLIDDSAEIGAGSIIGPNVVLGKNVSIAEGCRVQRTTIMEGAKVGKSAFLNSAIIGWRSAVGAWAHLQNETILGENVTVKDGVVINGAKVCLHKGVKEDLLTKGTIIL